MPAILRDVNDAPDLIDVTEATTRSGAARPRSRWPALVTLLLIAVVVLQITILSRLGDSADDLAAVADAVAGVEDDLTNLDSRMADLEVAAASAAASPAAPSPAGPTSLPDGYLPPFVSSQNDTAVSGQYVLGNVTGLSYYENQELRIDPADGTPRVWMVWAHWCPYCQQELPQLSEWWDANASLYPDVELVTISSSEDVSRGNPLVPYLDGSAFPFPVLIDDDLTLAQQFGTNAFPYWVVTGADGRVLLRVAGLLEIDVVARLFDEVAAQA